MCIRALHFKNLFYDNMGRLQVLKNHGGRCGLGRRFFMPSLAGWAGGLWLAAACTVAQAQHIATDERSQAVAQTVFAILGYTRWPTEPQTVRLCVLGPTEYADELLKGGHLASGRTVVVRRMRLDDPKISAQCNGVYAGILADESWRLLLSRLDGQPLLTISERKALCHIGGMFCLDVQPGGVAFEVNLDSVARSGVRVNPRVLQLARRKGNP